METTEIEIQNKILMGTPITKAWIGSGFSDYSTFYKAFKKNYGMSPNEFVQFLKNIS